jgi:hypothetical protein
MADNGVAMVNIWEARGKESMALLGYPAKTKRPTYYAAHLYANYGDTIVRVTSWVGSVTAHAARDSRTGAITLNIINRGPANANFQIVLDAHQDQQRGSLYLDLNAPQSINFSMAKSSMAQLVLDSRLNVIHTTLYSRDMYNGKHAPRTVNGLP